MTYSEKATDAAIATGKKLEELEISICERWRRSFAISSVPSLSTIKAPLQQTRWIELEKMRTDLLSAMFREKEG